MKKLVTCLVCFICLFWSISSGAFDTSKFELTEVITIDYVKIGNGYSKYLKRYDDFTVFEQFRIELGLEPNVIQSESIPGIHVYDADDEYIGLLVSTNISSFVIFNQDIESLIKIDARTGSVSNSSLYFESDDCTGKAYIGGGISAYQVGKVCDELYTGKRKKSVFKTIHSIMKVGKNGFCSCEQEDIENYFIPAVYIPAKEIGLYFPIKLPLRFKAWNMPTP